MNTLSSNDEGKMKESELYLQSYRINCYDGNGFSRITYVRVFIGKVYNLHVHSHATIIVLLYCIRTGMGVKIFKRTRYKPETSAIDGACAPFS